MVCVHSGVLHTLWVCQTGLGVAVPTDIASLVGSHHFEWIQLLLSWVKRLLCAIVLFSPKKEIVARMGRVCGVRPGCRLDWPCVSRLTAVCFLAQTLLP